MPGSEENAIAEILTAEQIGFAPDQLVACTNCTKVNAPDRQKCLYCGNVLPVTEINADAETISLRRLEAWEPGINLIFLGSQENVSAANTEAASRLIGIDPSALVSIIESGLPLPVARIEDAQSAEMAGTFLKDLGFETRRFTDRELNAEHPPIRLRCAEFVDDQVVFTDFNSGDRHSIALDEIGLIVTGRIYESRREEVTRRKGGAMKLLDEFETSGDLGVADIYSTNDAVGFRVQTNGFDFSVLGDEKEMLAGKNLEKFVDRLASRAVNGALVNEYDSVRHLLDAVWEPEIKKDLHGLQMRGYGKREFGATYTSSNLLQFAKYSRMRRLMI